MYTTFDEDLDLYARYPEPEDDIEDYARDVYRWYPTYSRQNPINPAKGNAVLSLVKSNQQEKVTLNRAGRSDPEIGFHAGTVQRIGQALSHNNVVAPRPVPRNFAEAQSQAYSRVWGDDPRRGHRGRSATHYPYKAMMKRTWSIMKLFDG